jgi:hypothetical protein
MANIAREGAEKRTQKVFKSDQVHVARPATDGSDGLLATGVSKTESNRLLSGDKLKGPVNDGGRNPATLKSGHRGEAPAVHPGMVSQRQRGANMADGNTVLGNAILSGSTKLKPDCPDK